MKIEHDCVNVGCGASPTPGWLNFDNSWSVRIARFRVVRWCVLPWVGTARREFIRTALASRVQWADAARLPLRDSSVRVVYTSHMLEHLDRRDVVQCLREIRRVLVPGGRVRIAVPDLHLLVQDYLQSGDADRLMERSFLCTDRPRSFGRKLLNVVVGERHHRWMYDGQSMSRLLLSVGFDAPAIVSAGRTTIDDCGDLDLNERADESVYVEASNPLRSSG